MPGTVVMCLARLVESMFTLSLRLRLLLQDWIQRVAHIPVDGRDGVPDVCVIELGGTVGDIESSPFVEALRQFQFKCAAVTLMIDDDAQHLDVFR